MQANRLFLVAVKKSWGGTIVGPDCYPNMACAYIPVGPSTFRRKTIKMDTTIRVNPSQSSPLHRHQSSLEGVLDFSAEVSLSADQRARASHQFHHIVRHFEFPAETRPYSRPLLVRYTYEYARSQESRDVFLQAFFRSMRLSIDDQDVDLGNPEVEIGL